MRCDSCDHVLANPVDIGERRTELEEHNIVLATLAIIAMLASTIFVFSGGAIIVVAPIGWLLYSFQRRTAARRYLARQRAPEKT